MKHLLTKQLKQTYVATLKAWREEINKYKNSQTSPQITPSPWETTGSSINTNDKPTSSSSTTPLKKPSIKKSEPITHTPSILTLSAYQSQLLQILESFYEETFTRAIQLHLRGIKSLPKKLDGQYNGKLAINASTLWNIKSMKSSKNLAESALEKYKTDDLEKNVKKLFTNIQECDLETVHLHRSLRNMFQHKNGLFKKGLLKGNYRKTYDTGSGHWKKVDAFFTENDKISLNCEELQHLTDAIESIIQKSAEKP